MKLMRHAALPLILMGLASAVQAQKMAPGLWETTMTVKSADGQMENMAARMQAQMASLPPEQRRMMEEMMAKQGINVSAGQAGAVRICISKEQAERVEPPASDGNCRNDSFQRSGATVKYRFSCANPPTKGSGEFTLVSDKAYQGRVVIESGGGKAGITEMQQRGKWVSANCGALKPQP
jgi:hypothetical protein